MLQLAVARIVLETESAQHSMYDSREGISAKALCVFVLCMAARAHDGIVPCLMLRKVSSL